MTDAQQILKMIEEVDPADSVKLNEIDARVWCYLDQGYIFSKSENNIIYFIEVWGQPVGGTPRERPNFIIPKYSTSRDALKAIRPEGWKTWVLFDGYREGAKFRAELFSPDKIFPNQTIQTDWLPTEELAELHAILQAIAHERKLND